MNAQGLSSETPQGKNPTSSWMETWTGLNMIIHKNRENHITLSSNDQKDWESYLGWASPGGQKKKVPLSSLSLPEVNCEPEATENLFGKPNFKLHFSYLLCTPPTLQPLLLEQTHFMLEAYLGIKSDSGMNKAYYYFRKNPNEERY